ncbi:MULTISPECIES: PspA/IM30 family protein [Sphingomonas]|uniref:PspA/IM30 family protein n=1 Tax=Sphingomonas TaxID=13687 RepID=UPI0006FB65C8|nr:MULTISPECIES: PspA/IM30 family protein [unclassified Sphingomonas]KQN06026.1 phage shock protein A [Sphingomonas sp. Leaf230]MDD1450454.1 PspA/IM30 family protein [Sphingomonas sp. H160509]RKE50500.1 phage shock protein A (PspA) family protein [Sphingomonas sp. PP-CC-1A-547]TCM08795.1 phage shock protein A (PspA) family protein [Sphingomonas sp. PP-CC-3G-468]SFN80568.1 phage shock protein A (PspA) family protein [Sphingomonas sp. OK281]
MAIWSKLFTLGRAGAHEAGAAVVDANALRILDQEIRDADKAQGKARDDLAGLVARRRILETEVESFRAQATKYEASARIAVEKGNMDLARQVAQRIADLEQDIALKSPQVEDMRAAEEQIHTAVAQTDRKIEQLRREVEVVKVNESVQKAQASVASGSMGAGNKLGSAADSLARIRERQAIRGERIKAAGELEDRRTGADLDEKLRLAGIGPGQSSADDVLARLTAPKTPELGQTLQIEQRDDSKTSDS